MIFLVDIFTVGILALSRISPRVRVRVSIVLGLATGGLFLHVAGFFSTAMFSVDVFS